MQLRPHDRPLAAPSLRLPTTAAGGVFDVRNPDWYEHRPTLLDLGRYPWPTYLPDPLVPWRPSAEAAPTTPPLLRYYLGWHMAPGLAARWLGPAALHWAVLFWTWAGVALVALLFTRGRRGRRLRGGAIAIALVVLFFFSGMDLVRVPVLYGREWVYSFIERSDWHALLYFEAGLFKLESRMHDVMWMPQHFLPAGLYALLCLHLCRQPRFLAVRGSQPALFVLGWFCAGAGGGARAARRCGRPVRQGRPPGRLRGAGARARDGDGHPGGGADAGRRRVRLVPV